MKKIISRAYVFVIVAAMLLNLGAVQVLADPVVGVVSAAITDTDDNSIDDISGGNAKFAVTVNNAAGKKMLAIMALKNLDGQLLNVQISEFKPNDNNNFTASVQMQDMVYDEANYIDCFLWNENLNTFIAKQSLGSLPVSESGEWVEANGGTISYDSQIMNIAKSYSAGASTTGYESLASYTLDTPIDVSYNSVTIEFKIKGNPLTWSRSSMTFNSEAWYAPFMVFTDADLRFMLSRTPEKLYVTQGEWYSVKMVFNPTKAVHTATMSYDYLVKDDAGTVLWQGNVVIPDANKMNYLPSPISTINMGARLAGPIAQAGTFNMEIKNFKVKAEAEPITVTSVNITSADNVPMGDTISLAATVAGTGNYSSDVTWSVTDGTGSATIDGHTLTPVSEGTVTVRATSVTDPTKYDEMQITITQAEEIIVDNIVITSSDSVGQGTTLALTATVYGTGSFNPGVTWSVTDGTGSATISGSTLTAVSAGTVTVTATSIEDPSVTSQMVVTITAPPSMLWTALDGSTTINQTASQTVISRTVTASTGAMYPSLARHTLNTPLSTNGQSVTLRFTVKGEYLNWARIAMTFNTSGTNVNNPPMFIQHDGKTNFNWNSSTGVLDPSKWYVITIVLNPTAAAYNANSMSFSYEVKEEATGTVFTSGTKTPANATEISTVIPETISAINWAYRTVTTPTVENPKTWQVTFKDFVINP